MSEEGTGPGVPPLFGLELLDRIVQWRLEQSGTEIQEGWLDDNDMLDLSRLPGHLRGSVDQMVRNAQPLVDCIGGMIRRRLT